MKSSAYGRVEKVHELLVSDSDARHTLELDDSFIIDTPLRVG